MPRPPAPPTEQTTPLTFTSSLLPWPSPPLHDHLLTLTVDHPTQTWQISFSASLPQNIPSNSPEALTFLSQSPTDQIAAGVQYTLHIRRRFDPAATGIYEWIARMLGLGVVVSEVGRGEFGAGLDVRWRIWGKFRQRWEWREVRRRDRFLARLGMREAEQRGWVEEWGFVGVEEIWIRGEGMWWAE